jgi:hypothetical protein
MSTKSHTDISLLLYFDVRFYKHFKVSIHILFGCFSLVRHSWMLSGDTCRFDVSQQRVFILKIQAGSHVSP